MDLNEAIKKELKEEYQEEHQAKTEAEKEELQKELEGKGEEYLDYVAQEDEEKGADATIDVQEQVQNQEKLEEYKQKRELERKKKFKDKEYIFDIAKKLYKRALKVDWPDGYTFKIIHDNIKGVGLKFTTPTGREFGKGIDLSLISKYDLNAIHVLVTQCENTVDRLEGRMAYQQKQKGQGIYMPDGSFKEFKA